MELSLVHTTTVNKLRKYNLGNKNNYICTANTKYAVYKNPNCYSKIIKNKLVLDSR